MAIWEEELHPRGGKGTPQGGQFVSKGGAGAATGGYGRGGWKLDDADRKEIAKYKDYPDNQESLKDGLKKVGEAELQAIDAYSMGSDVNIQLREGSRLAAIHKDTVKGLDSLMKKSKLSDDVLLHRAYSGNLFDNLTPGDVLLDKGFISTSLGPKAARYAAGSNELGMMTILAPAGSRGVTVYDKLIDYGAQKEVILDRGSKLVYLGDDTDGSKVFRLYQMQSDAALAKAKPKKIDPYSIKGTPDTSVEIVEAHAKLALKGSTGKTDAGELKLEGSSKEILQDEYQPTDEEMHGEASTAKTGEPWEAKLYRGVGTSDHRVESQFAEGTYFTPSKELAATYGTKVYSKVVRLDNPYVLDLKNKKPYYDELKAEFGTSDAKAITDKLVKEGHDGLIVRNVPVQRAPIGGLCAEVIVFKRKTK